ncbi:MAG: hypothetical protein WCC04_21110 [Terriglobales bacterium]
MHSRLSLFVISRSFIQHVQPPYLIKNWLPLLVMVTISTIAFGQDSLETGAADQVFSMVNQMRVAAGVPLLKQDQHIGEAATFHVIEFAKREMPADQYADEPWLSERLRMAEVRSGMAGELLLRAREVQQIPDKLKDDETLQKIFLNPKFTLAGFAAMRSGPWLYIVGDFVQLLDNLSIGEVEDLVVDTVQHRRTAKKITPFKVVPMLPLRAVACDMAKKDSLTVTPLNPYTAADNMTPRSKSFRMLSLATPDPRLLSNDVQGPTNDPKINALSVGVCFARSKTYPTGTYWIALEFYNARVLPE